MRHAIDDATEGIGGLLSGANRLPAACAYIFQRVAYTRALMRTKWVSLPGNQRGVPGAAAGYCGGAMMARDTDRPLFGRQSKVMTVEEVSEYLHVHPSTIYRLIKRRKIPAFRIGSDWRFNIETIDKWRSEMEAPEGQKKS